jgi:ABC-three component (ABC-3C) system Middle Component 1
MDLALEARKILETTNYSIKVSQTDQLFYFEDLSLFGFVWVAESLEEMLQDWKRKQDEFLREQDKTLRKSRDKSWNVYSVFLTSDDASKEENNQLIKIEEDFQGTRKLARAGLHSPSQVISALFPLIPIQKLVSLSEEDALFRLRSKLNFLPDEFLNAIVGSASVNDLKDILLRDHEDQSN